MPANDLSIYENFASEWWNPSLPHFRSLQLLTPFRLELILSWIGPVCGKKILDLGCGGGLLSVPLINAGAEVTGVDLSPASVAVAQKQALGKGSFLVGDAREVSVSQNHFDVVLLADVIDHIQDYNRALATAYNALRPGGLLFAGTINRTIMAHFFALILGEGLGFIPKGTHDSRLFVKPLELDCAALKIGFTCLETQGEAPCIGKTIINRAIQLRRSRCLQVAYSKLYQK